MATTTKRPGCVCDDRFDAWQIADGRKCNFCLEQALKVNTEHKPLSAIIAEEHAKIIPALQTTTQKLREIVLKHCTKHPQYLLINTYNKYIYDFIVDWAKDEGLCTQDISDGLSGQSTKLIIVWGTPPTIINSAEFWYVNKHGTLTKP